MYRGWLDESTVLVDVKTSFLNTWWQQLSSYYDLEESIISQMHLLDSRKFLKIQKIVEGLG